MFLESWKFIRFVSFENVASPPTIYTVNNRSSMILCGNFIGETQLGNPSKSATIVLKIPQESNERITV